MKKFFFEFVFPIHKHELKKFLLLGFLMFCIILNNTIVRNLKDSFLVMSNGAFSIPFIKIWGVLPVTFLALVLFAKISNKLSQEKVFYLSISFFLLFFSFFSFGLLPYQEQLQLHTLGEWLRKQLPLSFKEPIGLIEYWIYSCFYIFAELWGSLVVSILFWQFTNAVVIKDQAKKFYPLFGMIADLGMILGGILLVCFARSQALKWQTQIQCLTLLSLLSGIGIIAFYYFINRFFQHERSEPLETQQKTHLSLKESAQFLGKSPNLRYVGLMVFGFSITNNLIEVTWKCYLQTLCKGQHDFTEIMGYFSILTGLATITFGLIGGSLLRRRGWLFSALISPVFMLLIGIGFFGTLMMGTQTSLLASFGYTGSLLIVIIGSLQNVFGKALKFSIFDPTKEMTFIPLDIESKLKGKAAIDFLGVRIGKSIGSLFHQAIALIFGSFEAALGMYLGFFILVTAIWIRSVRMMYFNYVEKYGF